MVYKVVLSDRSIDDLKGICSKNGKLTRLQPEEIKPLAAAEDQASYNSK